MQRLSRAGMDSIVSDTRMSVRDVHVRAAREGRATEARGQMRLHALLFVRGARIGEKCGRESVARTHGAHVSVRV